MYVTSPVFLVGWLKYIKYNKIILLLGLLIIQTPFIVLYAVASEKFQDGNTKKLSDTVPSVYQL